MRSRAKNPTNTSAVYGCPKNCRMILDKNCRDEVMGETQETSVFTGILRATEPNCRKRVGLLWPRLASTACPAGFKSWNPYALVRSAGELHPASVCSRRDEQIVGLVCEYGAVAATALSFQVYVSIFASDED